MSWPNRYFAVRMYGDRYFGPVEDTAQFIAVVEGSIASEVATSTLLVPGPTSVVSRLPSYVFVPVTVQHDVGRPESDVSATDVSSSTSTPTSAPDLPADAHSEADVTTEVRYYTVAEVESTVNKRAN